MLAIEDQYRNEGYINARVTDIERRPTGRGDHIDLVLTIDEGVQHTVSSVSRERHLRHLTEEDIAKYLQMQPGHGLLGQGGARGYRVTCASTTGAQGYADINVLPQLTSAGPMAQINIDYNVFEGAAHQPSGMIDIIGNEKTQDRVIRRELAILPGRALQHLAPRGLRQRASASCRTSPTSR